VSTPNEGPARSWTPGDVQAAAKVFAGLNTSEQKALMRSIRTHEMLAPVHNRIERTVAFTRASIEGLSDYAQQLAAGGRAWASAAADRVGQVRDSANQFRQNTAERVGTVKENAGNRAGALSARAAELVKQAREGASNKVEWTKTSAAGLANRAVAGMNAGRQTAVNLKDQAVAAGQQKVASGVAAGREAAGKVGRWFNNQISKAAVKASATFAGIAERRMDPALQGPDLKLPDNLQLTQHMAEIASAQTPEQLNTAMGNLSTFANEKLTQMQGAQAGVAEAQNAARLLQGVAPASGITGKSAPQAAGQAQGQQGEAVNLNKGQKPSGQTPER
jgi:hypothetical protein